MATGHLHQEHSYTMVCPAFAVWGLQLVKLQIISFSLSGCETRIDGFAGAAAFTEDGLYYMAILYYIIFRCSLLPLSMTVNSPWFSGLGYSPLPTHGQQSPATLSLPREQAINFGQPRLRHRPQASRSISLHVQQ
jgi:hypothetical protein